MGVNTATGTDTRDRILDAGSAAIVAKSFNACGLSEILSAAGVPKGSFYHYFKSKEDFGVALIERSFQQHAARVRACIDDTSLEPLDRIRLCFGECRDHYAEHGPTRECVLAKIALETAQLSEPMRAAIKKGYEGWAALLAQAIEEAQEKGQITSDLPPQALADLLVNSWEGATIRMQIDRDVAPLTQFMDVVFKCVLGVR